MRVRWELVTVSVSLILCGWMSIGTKPMLSAEDSRTAVLETRANQIEEHLRATDANVEKLSERNSAQGNQLSEMQGEERAAWAILTLLTAGNFMIQVRRNGKKEAS